MSWPIERPRGAALAAGLAAGLVAAVASATGTIGALVLLGVVAAGLALALSAKQPVLVLCLGILSIPLQSGLLGTSDPDGGSGFGLTLPEVLFLLSGYGWALGRLLQGRLPYAPHPLTTPLLFMTLAFFPGFLVAEDPFAVFKVLVNWVAFLMIFQMLAADADERTIYTLLGSMAVAGAAVGLIAMLNTGIGQQQYDPLTNTSSARGIGPFTHPSQLGLFLVLVVPAAMVIAAVAGVRLRMLALAAAGIACVGIALSLSRGAMLALGGGAAVLLVWGPFRRLFLVALVAVFALSFVGVNPLEKLVNTEVLSQRIGSTGYAVGGADPRINVFKQTPRMIADYPVFGVGADNFLEVAGDYDMLDTLTQSLPGHAHNIPLNVAAENGLVGLAALIWFAVVLMQVTVSVLGRARGRHAAMAVGTASSLLALTLYGMTDYPLTVNVLAAMTFAWAGVLPALDRLVGETADERMKRPWPAIRPLPVGTRSPA